MLKIVIAFCLSACSVEAMIEEFFGFDGVAEENDVEKEPEPENEIIKISIESDSIMESIEMDSQYLNRLIRYGPPYNLHKIGELSKKINENKAKLKLTRDF